MAKGKKGRAREEQPSSAEDIEASLRNKANSYIIRDLDTGLQNGKNVNNLVGLASVTKTLTAAVILHAKGNEYLDDAAGDSKKLKSEKSMRRNSMRRFLSRSDNSQGERLAINAFGSPAKYYAALKDFADKQGLTSMKIDPAYGIESRTTRYNNEGDNNHLYLSLKDATTGLNATDGHGPQASAQDVAKILTYLYGGDKDKGGKFDGAKGDFLNDYASPESGLGHTMQAYAFNRSGIDVLGAKSGTNPGAGDITGGIVFKNEKNGHTYVAFAHMKNTSLRPGVIQALEDITKKPWEKLKELAQSNPPPPRPPANIGTGAAQVASAAPAAPGSDESWSLTRMFGDIFSTNKDADIKAGAKVAEEKASKNAAEQQQPVRPGTAAASADTSKTNTATPEPSKLERAKKSNIKVAHRQSNTDRVPQHIRAPYERREARAAQQRQRMADAEAAKAMPRQATGITMPGISTAQAAPGIVRENDSGPLAASMRLQPQQISGLYQRTGLSAFVFGRTQQAMMEINLEKSKAYGTDTNIGKASELMRAVAGDVDVARDDPGYNKALATKFAGVIQSYQEKVHHLKKDGILGTHTAGNADRMVAQAYKRHMMAHAHHPMADAPRPGLG